MDTITRNENSVQVHTHRTNCQRLIVFIVPDSRLEITLFPGPMAARAYSQPPHQLLNIFFFSPGLREFNVFLNKAIVRSRQEQEER